MGLGFTVRLKFPRDHVFQCVLKPKRPNREALYNWLNVSPRDPGIVAIVALCVSIDTSAQDFWQLHC